jgi:hypothetical protein
MREFSGFFILKKTHLALPQSAKEQELQAVFAGFLVAS